MRVLTILLLAGAVAWSQEDAEVETLAQRLKGADALAARLAADRLAEMGPAAKDAVASLTQALKSSDPELRWRAAWALSRIGPAAGAAAPELVRTYDEDKSVLVVGAAEIAIHRIGAAAEEPLLQSIAKTKGLDRAYRLRLLGKIGAGPRGIDSLARLIASADEVESYEAAKAIQEIGASARSAIPQLIQAISGKKRFIFYYSGALVAIGEPCVEPLVRLFHDGNETQKSRALGLLVRLGAYERVDKILAGELEGDVVSGALLGMTEVGPAAAVLVPAIERASKSEAPSYMARAFLAVGDEGAAGLIRILKDGDKVTQVSLLRQIRYRIELHDPGWTEARRDELFPLMLRLVVSKSAKVRVAALEAMQLMEFERLQSPKVARAVVKLLKAFDGETRVEAARLLGSLGRGAKPALRALRKAKADGFHSVDLVRIAAAGALCRLGAGGQKEVDLLLEFLEGDNEGLQIAALEALVDAGPVARSAHMKLLEILKQTAWRRGWDRGLAAEALGAMMPGLGPDRAKVLDTITKIKGERLYDVREAFLRGLLRSSDAEAMLLLQRKRGSVFEVADLLLLVGKSERESLKNGLKHLSPYVRRLAAEVLVRVAPGEATDDELVLALDDGQNMQYHDTGQELVEAYRSISGRAVPVMVGALKHESLGTRAAAIHVLGQLGASSRSAVPALRAVVNSDPNIYVRRRALSAVDRILAAE